MWVDDFKHVERLFDLPTAIRHMVYATNLAEGGHSGLRKVARGKAAFPYDDALFMPLFLRVQDMAKKWTVPMPNWALALGSFDLLFPDLL